MRFIHTSDWHLGHTLYDQPRTREHGAFLDWLRGQCAQHDVDALLIAGDLFDTAHPSAEAQAAWFSFLAQLRAERPRLTVIAIGGNHDSPARLDAPGPLLDALGVHLVGGLPRREGGALDVDRLLVPLREKTGQIAAWVAAVPFLRPSDLPLVEDGDGLDKLIEGVRRVYAEVFLAARARLSAGQALVAMGHLYMVGTRVSELSERKILGGNQHALPETLFPDDVAYVALGHLHQLQHVGDRKHVMYCGAPLPLSLKEAVRGLSFKAAQLVELADGKLVAQRPLMIPQVGEFLRVPDLDARGEDTFAPLEAVLEQLKSLPALDPVHPEARPFLEVCVALEKPEPLLKHQVEDALVGKAARLVRLQAKTTGTSKSLAEATAHRNLKEISPEEVFRAQWSREHQGAVPEPLLKAFHELIEAVGRGETP